MATPDARVIMLSVGEASGDLHGEILCRALRSLDPGVRLVGMGGPRMARAGMEVLADPTAQAVVGMTEAVGRVPALYRAYRNLVRRIRRERPHALVLIDFPEFNMRLGRAAHRAGVPVLYFIPPQLWAWRPGRARQIAAFAARVLAIFPFERAIYEAAGAPVEFVGHPLLDAVPLDMERGQARGRLGVDPAVPMIGLLPGSRPGEVRRLLGPMFEAARILSERDARRRFVLGLAPGVDRGRIEAAIATAGSGPRVDIVERLTHEVMAAADVLLVASGTATLEAALLGTSMVVCYRVSRTTLWIARRLALVPWISLPNVVAGRFVVPELLQDDVTGSRLAELVEPLLAGGQESAAQQKAFAELRAALGEPGVGLRAARAVLEVARG